MNNQSMLPIALAYILWSMSSSIALTFLPLFSRELGAAPVQVGLVETAAYVGAALALVPAGLAADRFGRLPTLATAWGVGAAGAIAVGTAHAWSLLLPGSFFMLVGGAAIPALAALVTESAEPHTHRRLLGLLFAGGPGGALAGSLLAGWWADHFGLRLLFQLAAGLGALAILTLAPAAEPPAQPTEPPDLSTEPPPLVKQQMIVGAISAAVYFMLSLPGSFLTPYLRDALGVSLTGAGVSTAQIALGQLAWSALFAVWPGALGMVRLTSGPLRGLRFERGALVALLSCLAANAAFGLLFPFSRGFALSAALLLRGALFTLQPLGMALVAGMAGGRGGGNLASQFSLVALMVGLVTACAPTVAGALYRLGRPLPFLVAGAAGFLACVGVALLLLHAEGEVDITS